MAPESLRSWQFSDKSTVWSFAVLLWEMFSYGMQPYCGYSNHEVLDMVSRRQLLSCPDQCPAKIYSLMHECWAEQALQRPSFKVRRFTNFSQSVVVLKMAGMVQRTFVLHDRSACSVNAMSCFDVGDSKAS